MHQSENLYNLGYTPLGITTGTKGPTMTGWPDIDRDLLYRAATESDTLGVRCGYGNLIGIDVDIYDPAISKLMLDWFGGNIKYRIGQSPKFLVPAISPEIQSKITSSRWISPDGKINAIEILTTGQQFLVSGIHQVTGQPYTWPAGDIPPQADLPVITLHQITKFIEYFEFQAEMHGWELVRLLNPTEKLSQTDEQKNFNRLFDIKQVLTEYGWTHSGGINWTRPGKDKRHGSSATVNGNTVHIFTNAAPPFIENRTYHPWHIIQGYAYNGDGEAMQQYADKMIAESNERAGFGQGVELPAGAILIESLEDASDYVADNPHQAPEQLLMVIGEMITDDDLSKQWAEKGQSIIEDNTGFDILTSRGMSSEILRRISLGNSLGTNTSMERLREDVLGDFLTRDKQTKYRFTKSLYNLRERGKVYTIGSNYVTGEAVKDLCEENDDSFFDIATASTGVIHPCALPMGVHDDVVLCNGFSFLIGATTNAGKTEFACTAFVMNVVAGHKVIYYCTENSAKEIASICLRRAKSMGIDEREFSRSVNKTKSNLVEFTGGLRERDLDAIVLYDYLSPDFGSDEDWSKFGLKCKDLALQIKKGDGVLIAFCQIHEDRKLPLGGHQVFMGYNIASVFYQVENGSRLMRYIKIKDKSCNVNKCFRFSFKDDGDGYVRDERFTFYQSPKALKKAGFGK